MEMKGERRLPVDRDTAWRELNDIDALKAAVPGCESLAPAGDNAYDVVVNAALGPVKARFKGRLQLSDVQPPRSYALGFDVQGGAAGFSRGQAKVALEPAGARETIMRYDVQASIGGKLAQIGSRLVDAGAATLADKFFATFAVQLALKYPPPAGEPAPVAVEAPTFWGMVWKFLKMLFGRK